MKHDDDLDAFMRAATPPGNVSPERLANLVATTMVRVPLRRSWRDAVRAWWPDVVGRYAVPMATAAMLGLIVGHHVVPAEDGAVQIVALLSPSIVLAGF